MILGVVGLLVVGAVIVSLAGSDDDQHDNESSANAVVSGSAPAPEAAQAVAGDASEADDVAPCVLVDGQTVRLDITNNSSKQSNYLIDVNYLDAAGQRIADEPMFVNHVRPNERTVEDNFAFSADGAASCEIAGVERLVGESPNDVGETACSVNGTSVLGDIETSFTATNSSSGLSDYLISAALVRDGVRIGTATAAINNVQPGQAAPGPGLTTVDGPADGVTCEVVHVIRTAS